MPNDQFNKIAKLVGVTAVTSFVSYSILINLQKRATEQTLRDLSAPEIAKKILGLFGGRIETGTFEPSSTANNTVRADDTGADIHNDPIASSQNSGSTGSDYYKDDEKKVPYENSTSLV